MSWSEGWGERAAVERAPVDRAPVDEFVEGFAAFGVFGAPPAPRGRAAREGDAAPSAWTPASVPALRERFVTGGTPAVAMPAVPMPGAAPALPSDAFTHSLPDFGVADDGDADPFADLADADAHATPNGFTSAAAARAGARRAAARARLEAEKDAAVEAMRLEAEQAIADLQAQHEQALQQAWAEGAQQGRADAEQELQGAFQHALEALQASADALRTHEERWLANLEENVAALAVAVASQLVQRAAAADASIAVDFARRAIADFPADEPLVLRCHPDDLAALRAALDDPDAAAVRRELRWTPDARLMRGGVLAEGRERIVDGRVDAGLERMYRAMAKHHA